MGEFIIAVLIVSVLWAMWDVVKLLLGDWKREEQTAASYFGPGKERLERYAQSFSYLASTFRHMPSKKERFTEKDVRGIFREVQEKVCAQCPRQELCWKEEYYRTYRRAYNMLNAIEEEGEEMNQGRQEAFLENCLYGDAFMGVMMESFRRAKLNLMWSNRLLENRAAVAEQLYETSLIIQKAASAIYDIKKIDNGTRKQIEVKLKLHGVLVKDMWGLQKEEDRQELFLTLKTSRKGRCMSTREIGHLISEFSRGKMIPDRDSRAIINHEYSTVLFVEEPAYCMLNGASKVTKEGEMVSGDNFTLFSKDNGQMIMSLSDGMGSGLGACRESETVIELLEQFLHAGFGKEAAVRMIHSVMLLQNNDQMFSTVDLCMVDLYSGECEILKIGAASTFLKRGDWVESITSTSMPMGILQDVDYECTKKQLKPGDFIIMVSDGILDALPSANGEEILKDMILAEDTNNAKELSKAILEKVLGYQYGRAEDDMTVLVGSFWKR